jgi:hypothetical protein
VYAFTADELHPKATSLKVDRGLAHDLPPMSVSTIVFWN